MTESVAISDEKLNLNGTNTNDVVPLQCTTMATEEETAAAAAAAPTHNDYYKTLICSGGAGDVSSLSSLSLNDTIRTTLTVPAEAATVRQNTSNTDSTEEEKMMIPNAFVNANKLNAINVQNNNNSSSNNNNNNNNINNINSNNNTNNGNNHMLMKTKRRRRKSSKQKTNAKPYKKSNWNFQKRPRNGSSRLVPYNTNEFLMEEHMPEINGDTGRCRDSSFSFDSDNDKEEYLSKEFCSVYENARSDRLYDMTKSQLIQEYLQLEASYDKLSNSLGKVTDQLGSRNGGNVLKRLADRISELSAENLELRRQMADIRSRDSRHHNHNHCGSHHKSSHMYNNKTVASHAPTHPHKNATSSEDSESDSSSSSSSSSNSSSNSDSSTNSNSSNRSKSSQMSGISDNADECSQLLIKNEYGSVADDDTLNRTTNNQIFGS